MNRKQLHDPVLALARDNLYKEELWEDHFDEWESGKDSSFDHVVKSNAGQLCAVAAMRTIGMAHAQHEKYLRACKSLEKTGRNFLKVQGALNLISKFLVKLCSKYAAFFEMQHTDFVCSARNLTTGMMPSLYPRSVFHFRVPSLKYLLRSINRLSKNSTSAMN